MALYDPTGHPLLSGAAAALEAAGALEEQAEMAIDLLGLRNTEYRGDAERSAVRAVAIQVNYQVEMGVEGVTYSSLSRGARSFESRDGLVDPRAQAIVDGLALTGAGGEPGDLWPTVGSFRPTV